MTPPRFEEEKMLALCGSAMGKIDTRGRRGTEKVTHEEIEALAALAETLGAGSICASAYERSLGQTVLAAGEAGNSIDDPTK